MRNRDHAATHAQHRVTETARWCVWLCLVPGALACAPLSPTPPFHFAETAKVISHGHVALSGAVGGGKFEDLGAGLGFAARARVGVADRHELGVDWTVFRRMNHDDPTDERPWLGPSTAILGKAAWKMALTSWLAASAGAGGSHGATGNAVGGDLAMIASTPGLFVDRFRPYGGIRGLVAVPVGRDRDEAGGVTKGLVLAFGSTWELSPEAHLLLEVGAIQEWNRGYFATAVDVDREIQEQSKAGGYVALGGGIVF